MVDVRKKALENIEKAQGRQKVYYDQIHCKDRELYEVGTLVLLKNSKKLIRKKGPRWSLIGQDPTLFMKYCLKVHIVSPTPNMTRLKIFYQRGAVYFHHLMVGICSE